MAALSAGFCIEIWHGTSSKNIFSNYELWTIPHRQNHDMCHKHQNKHQSIKIGHIPAYWWSTWGIIITMEGRVWVPGGKFMDKTNITQKIITWHTCWLISEVPERNHDLIWWRDEGSGVLARSAQTKGCPQAKEKFIRILSPTPSNNAHPIVILPWNATQRITFNWRGQQRQYCPAHAVLFPAYTLSGQPTRAVVELCFGEWAGCKPYSCVFTLTEWSKEYPLQLGKLQILQWIYRQSLQLWFFVSYQPWIGIFTRHK